MRKEVGLLLASAVCFDLGVVSVQAQQAAVDYFLKIEGIDSNHNFQKLDMANPAAAKTCVGGKGTLVEFKGTKYCRTDKTALPSSTQKK